MVAIPACMKVAWACAAGWPLQHKTKNSGHREKTACTVCPRSSPFLPSIPSSSLKKAETEEQRTMAATLDTSKDGDGEDQVLSYQPLAVNSAVSANPHIPSVTASAVLGESESVSRSFYVSRRRYYARVLLY